jgi:hypothetical protein
MTFSKVFDSGRKVAAYVVVTGKKVGKIPGNVKGELVVIS